jgi:hypothetical protein
MAEHRTLSIARKDSHSGYAKKRSANCRIFIRRIFFSKMHEYGVENRRLKLEVTGE